VSEEGEKRVNQDPMHGVTLKMMLEFLVEELGWEEMAKRIRVNCFSSDPSFSSSLKFLRKNGWAKTKVEKLYLEVVTSS